MTKTYVTMPPSIEEVDRIEPGKAALEGLAQQITDHWRPRIEAARSDEERARLHYDYRVELDALTRPLVSAIVAIKALECPTMMVVDDGK